MPEREGRHAAMIITDIDEFLPCYDRAKARTRRLLALIPPKRLEWRIRPEGFTLGDLVRHMVLLERQMFAENVSGRPARPSPSSGPPSSR